MLYLGTTNRNKVAEIAALLAPLGLEVRTVALDVPEPHATLRANAIAKGEAYAKHSGGVAMAEDSGLFIPTLDDLPGPWSARFSDSRLILMPPRLRGKMLEISNESPIWTRDNIEALEANDEPNRDALNVARVLSLLRDPTSLGHAAIGQSADQVTEGNEHRRILGIIGHDVPALPPHAAEFRVVLVVVHPIRGLLFEVEARYNGWIADPPRGDRGFGYDSIFVGHDTFGATLAELDVARKNLRSHRKIALDAFYAWASQNLGELT